MLDSQVGQSGYFFKPGVGYWLKIFREFGNEIISGSASGTR
jgi:hypothetical protein